MRVQFKTENILVALAAAGCGKTYFLREKVEAELESVRPEDIAYVSYTRQGANGGKSEVMESMNLEEESLPFFGTLHSLTYKALGLEHKNLFSSRHKANFNELMGFNLTTNPNNESNTQEDKFLVLHDLQRSGGSQVDSGEDQFDRITYERFVRSYEKYKKTFGLIDFMDCLLLFVERGEPIPVKVAFIDEAQDLTDLQWRVCETAFSLCDKIYIAGDDYQSIYTFAGANPDHLVDLASRYETTTLKYSYRLPTSVCALAKNITSLLSKKIDKDYNSFKSTVGKIEDVVSKDILATQIAKKVNETWLFLFRNNCFAPEFETFLLERIIPYHNNSGFCINERLLQRIKKYYNFRKIGFLTDRQKEEFAKEFGIKDFQSDFTESNLIKGEYKYTVQMYVDRFGIDKLLDLARGEPRMRVTTVHRAKGAEAQNVAFFLDCTRKVMRNFYIDTDNELRLLYVACTRAKENLYLVGSETSFGLDDMMRTILEM